MLPSNKSRFCVLAPFCFNLGHVFALATSSFESSQADPSTLNDEKSVTYSSQSEEYGLGTDVTTAAFSNFESSLKNFFNTKNIENYLNDSEAKIVQITPLVSPTSDTESTDFTNENTNNYLVNTMKKHELIYTRPKNDSIAAVSSILLILGAIFVGTNILTRVRAKPEITPLDEDEKVYQDEIDSFERISEEQLTEFYDDQHALDGMGKMADMFVDDEKKAFVMQLKEVLKDRMDFERQRQKEKAYELGNVTLDKLQKHFQMLHRSFKNAALLTESIFDKDRFSNTADGDSVLETLSYSCSRISNWLGDKILSLNKSKDDRDEIDQDIIKQWMEEAGTNDIFRAVRVKAEQEYFFNSSRGTVTKELAKCQIENEQARWGILQALIGTKITLPFAYNKPKNVDEEIKERKVEQTRIIYIQNSLGSPSYFANVIASLNEACLNEITAINREERDCFSDINREILDVGLWDKRIFNLLVLNDRAAMEDKGNYIETPRRWATVRKKASLQMMHKLTHVLELSSKEINDGNITQDSKDNEENIKYIKKVHGIIPAHLNFYDSLLELIQDSKSLSTFDIAKPLLPQLIAKFYENKNFDLCVDTFRTLKFVQNNVAGGIGSMLISEFMHNPLRS